MTSYRAFLGNLVKPTQVESRTKEKSADRCGLARRRAIRSRDTDGKEIAYIFPLLSP